ncbi:unnamed protein product [Trichobilharzia szidati]|nr:unnamed protein product [Trichobilharzia szidati]
MPPAWLCIKDAAILTIGVIVYFFVNLINSIRLYLFPVYKSLKNEVILITGAANGLGRLLCVEFSRHCPTILALDVDEIGLKETAELVANTTGCQIKTYKCNLKDKHEIDKVVRLIRNDFGKVTVLVNNAGITNMGGFFRCNREQFEDLIKVNTLAQYHLTKEFLPSMLGKRYNPYSSVQSSEEPHGHIVCLASICGVMAFQSFPIYCASKAAVLLLMESLELELASLGITNEICITRVLPYLIKTNMASVISGTRSGVFVVSDAKWCAKRIVDGVLKNERVVYIPGYMRIFAILKLLSPGYAYRYLHKMMANALIFVQKMTSS